MLIGSSYTADDALNLSEYFLAHECSTRVVFVPCMTDGGASPANGRLMRTDLRNRYIETSVGFDSCSHYMAALVANIAADAASSAKCTCGRDRR